MTGMVRNRVSGVRTRAGSRPRDLISITGRAVGSAGSIICLQRSFTEGKEHSKDPAEGALNSHNLSLLLLPRVGVGDIGRDRVLSADG